MRKKDLCLILAFLLIAGLIYMFTRDGAVGNQVRITLDGEEYGTYSLSEDQEVPVQTEYGYNIVQIEDGMVFMKDADCPDKYCIHQGKTNRKNQSIVCLPHKLMVEVVEASKDRSADGIDAMAQ